MAAQTQILSNGRVVELLPAAGLTGAVLMMVLPVPPFLLDLALVGSIALSLTVLIVALYVRDALDFSSFPSVLLFATLFRLALNVASTRLVLVRGEEGAAAAGRVIEAFGRFVVSGNYVVGFIVFVILVVINFIVITKGATRIAEVAARFTLDAMPGKQMAIDADLNAGLINEAEARQRRQRIQKEGDFYGAMDGASKFVRGDAIAGLVILAINLVGGFFVGVMQKGMGFAEAARLYSLLSIGDGLASQVPALIISTATGMVVTRTASTGDLGPEIARQLLWSPKALSVVAVLLGLFAFIPGFPALPFLAAAGSVGFLARAAARTEACERSETPAEAKQPERREEGVQPQPIDLLELQVGYELIPMVDGEHGGVVERIRALRRQFLSDRGFLVPQIHIRDNLRLGSKQYAILVKGVEAGKGELRPGRLLAMNAAGAVDADLPGEPTKEPAFGLPARWISPADRERAEMMGCTVVDPETVLITHLSELIKRYSPELITRQDVQRLLDALAREHPKVVEELIPHHMTLGGVQKVLQNLLREDVPIRDLLTIVETLADRAPDSKDTDELTEHVRQALARAITLAYRSPEGVLPVMTVDPQIERMVRERAQEGVPLEPQAAQRIMTAVQRAAETFTARGLLPVFLAGAAVRRQLRQLIGHYLPQIAVLSHNEIADGVKVQSLGVVRWSDES
ncbi:MAG TPA: flagellar biosynthesis protein FlhA [candidate division Zixibacteria bacterium]|nr:flagellar biosynthesis protein FlhA [candidate division Zixibacteria bacterium]